MSAPSEIISGAVSDAPKVLGREMFACGTHSWALSFAGFSVLLNWHRANMYDGICFGGVVAWRKSLPECIAAIERELLSIRAAIPDKGE